MTTKKIIILAAIGAGIYYIYKKRKEEAAEKEVAPDASTGINGAQYLEVMR